MKRAARWVLLAVALLAPVAALACMQLYQSIAPKATLVIRSSPERATVFGERGTLGFTPLHVTLAPGEQRALRFVRKDCQDVELLVRADDYLPSGALARLRWLLGPPESAVSVALPSRAEGAAGAGESGGSAKLVVTTDPTATEVFLDGRRLGVTPLALDDLAAGSRTLRLLHPDCVEMTETVRLEDGKETKVARILESRWVGFYRERIQKEPGNLNHYAELAHHYTRKGQFAESLLVLQEGLDAMKRPDASQHARYWAEIIHIYQAYYVYPPETPDHMIRPGLRELMKYAKENNLNAQTQLDKLVQQMDAVDAQRPLPRK